MHHSKSSLLLLCLLASSPLAIATPTGKTIAMQGNNKGATACIACHGVDGAGMSSAGFPRLAGLDQNYLVKQLHDMAGGSRNSAVMSPVAKALEKQEILDVAAYFASLPAPENKPSSHVDATLLKQGQKIAEQGNWNNNVPACFSCHGVGASGVGAHFPALTGQSASYLAQQLHAWKTGQRHNDPNDLMKGVAQRLNETEIQAVTAYLASLPAQDRH